ncbi:MAG: hypothetical protein IPM54_14530 [Polyangiaceae bacterium]|nr:hypothetical protein [Polyangiaceae bacterium]
MMRLDLDGFSLDLPPCWSGLEDVTYSDPTTLPPVAFAADGGTGRLMVAEMLFEDDEEPGTEPSAIKALAIAWGKRRRVQPLELGTVDCPEGAAATATYFVRGCFVQVWFLSNGERVVQASYVCPWDKRTAEQNERESIVRSLRWS